MTSAEWIRRAQGLLSSMWSKNKGVTEAANKLCLEPPNDWINVKDRVPANGQSVIVAGPDVMEGYCYNGTWYSANDVLIDPTHWQPLPEPPKNEGGEREP